MKEYIYKPKAEFEGHVKLALLKHIERLELLKDMQFKINEAGEVDNSSIDGAGYAMRLYSLVKDRVKEVKLKHKSSGEEFDSLDDLEYYNEGMELITEMGSFLIGGLQLGKSLKKK